MVTVSPPKPTSDPLVEPVPWAYALQLPHDARAPRVARSTLRVVLATHGLMAFAEAAELLTSELVSNAYLHAEGDATLRLRALDGGRRLRVSVWDSNPHIPPPFDRRPGGPGLCSVPVEADGGRGLFLVCHYADAWGGYPLGDDLFGRGGKLLWCELGRHAARQGAAA
ncbi:ATP-binding protein [Streptomyces sp. NPDC087300]|uniref:ATP-binding protein n=1 Tax=Streptomyces sp. NPDC087300 TaxID=3365780 RepID=UPI0038133581